MLLRKFLSLVVVGSVAFSFTAASAETTGSSSSSSSSSSSHSGMWVNANNPCRGLSGEAKLFCLRKDVVEEERQSRLEKRVQTKLQTKDKKVVKKAVKFNRSQIKRDSLDKCLKLRGRARIDCVSLTRPRRSTTDNKPNTVAICHKPGLLAQQTLHLPQTAVNDHLAHGDKLGACAGSSSSMSSSSSVSSSSSSTSSSSSAN